MIGLSVSINTRPFRETPRWLAAKMSAMVSSDLVGLWLADDAVISGGEVMSITGRVGGNLTYDTPSSARKFTASVIGRRAAFTSSRDIGNSKSLVNAAMATAKSFIFVADVPAPDGLAVRSVCTAASPNAGAVWGSGTDTWFAAAGWSFYQNGVLSNSTAGGACVFEAANASNASGGIWLGGYNLASQTPFDGLIGCVAALANVPSAANRAEITSILRSYYGI